MKKNVSPETPNGILLIDKEAGSTSFHLVALLRRLTKVSKIGHAGTLDTFATGVMVMLIGILGLILLMVVGGEMGKRVQPQDETEQAEVVGAG